MNIKNCKKCNRIFANDSFDLCPICRNSDVEEFKAVKDFLYDNPGADIQTVSEVTGVDTKKILKFLREGKLEITDSSPNLILDCERCGAPIKTGKFCNKCISEMEREFRGAVSGNIPGSRKDLGKSSDRMYIAERRKK
ncbi:TIGR03826 family flagellar region protein [Proteiniborus sp. MB09-C3]|uniref:TIGR03826 family flagellar region protein n=1 Tax=Proteiniborus sp. MB09-C3 TaxID=3050072 RepID=UPI0025560CB3|nr:TIGR03826 family flagellar region protein [Proteiniborus sp. MB09-C3]WIV12055.1 MerR family transcriptional regulator [Proteiniborus sp. MB09-C3]